LEHEERWSGEDYGVFCREFIQTLEMHVHAVCDSRLATTRAPANLSDFQGRTFGVYDLYFARREAYGFTYWFEMYRDLELIGFEGFPKDRSKNEGRKDGKHKGSSQKRGIAVVPTREAQAQAIGFQP